MVEQNQSGMTEERMNAVLARDTESPAPESDVSNSQIPNAQIPNSHIQGTEDAQAVTETPSDIPNPATELHAQAHPAGEPAPLPESEPALSEPALSEPALSDSVPLEPVSAEASPAGADADADANAEPVANGTATVDPLEVGIASGVQYRQDTRYEVEGDAEVFVQTGSMGTTLLRGHILDLSSSGCFIQTMARVMIKPGTVVQLIFSVYGTTFRIDATSRFARMRVGVGFRFLEMDEPTHKRLTAVLFDIRSRLIHENQPIIDRAIAE